MVDCEKRDAALKITPKDRKKRATAADKRVATLKIELANANALHPRLVEVFTHFEVDTDKTRTNLQNSQERLSKVEQETMLVWEGLDRVRKQSAGSTKAGENALRQLTEGSNRAQALEVEVRFLKSKIDGAVETGEGAISSANEKGREAKMLGSRVGFLKDELDSPKLKESTGCNMEGCVASSRIPKAK